MLSLYNYNCYATSTFIEILLLPKMKYMTKTFFFKSPTALAVSSLITVIFLFLAVPLLIVVLFSFFLVYAYNVL